MLWKKGGALLTRFAIGLVLASVLAFAASAQDARSGAAAYARGDFSAAAELWRPLARKGDAEAQYGLAELYAKGQGVDRNPQQAVT